MRVKMKEIKQLYILVGILLPILFAYTTPIKGFTIGDAFLILGIICLVVFQKNLRIKKSILCILIYNIILLIWVILSTAEFFSVLMTTLRYIVYIVYILCLPSVKSEIEFAKEAYKKVCCFSAILLVIQYVLLNLFDICMPGVFQFLPLTDSSLYDYAYAVRSTNSMRVMSLFGEPSHYALYILPVLILILFEKRKILNKDMILAIGLSLTVIMCASFAGIAGLLFIWIMWLFYLFKSNRVTIKIFLICMIAVISAVYVIFCTDLGYYITSVKTLRRQWDGRFSGFVYLLGNMGPLETQLFGNGMKDLASNELYLSGWPRLYYYYGIIGGGIYLLSLSKYMGKKKISNIFLLLLFFMMVGTEVNFMPIFVTYAVFFTMYEEIEYFSIIKREKK